MNKKLLALSALLAFNVSAFSDGGAFEGQADFIFPQGLGAYEAGTTVESNGRLYQCKEFPNSGFCGQWTPSANQYQPGVGFAWKQAWVDITPKAEEGTGHDYDFPFPVHQGLYRAGVVVSQDGEAYQCKEAPFDGFCTQGNFGSNEYDPGVGHAWEQAWIHLGPAGNQKSGL